MQQTITLRRILTVSPNFDEVGEICEEKDSDETQTNISRRLLTVPSDFGEVGGVLKEMDCDDGVMRHEVAPQELRPHGLYDEGLGVVLQKQLSEAPRERFLVRHVVGATSQLRLRDHESAVG